MLHPTLSHRTRYKCDVQGEYITLKGATHGVKETWAFEPMEQADH